MQAVNQQTLINGSDRQMAMLGGGLCLLIAARQHSWKRIILGLLGAGLLYRGLKGRLLGTDYDIAGKIRPNRKVIPKSLDVSETIIVNRSPEEVYRFWRDLENLPRFMSHLESVQQKGDGRSHWVMKMPGGIGMKLEWEAAIVEDEPNKVISWQTLPLSNVQHAGEVRFVPVPGSSGETHGRGTQVTVSFRYYPPGGIAGEAFAHLTNSITEQQIREEVRRFKQVMETGEVATIEGQPSAR